MLLPDTSHAVESFSFLRVLFDANRSQKQTSHLIDRFGDFVRNS